MSTSSIVIVGLLNILVIGLFYVFIFKRKVTLTTYTDKVVFNSNLILMLISLHYLSAIVLYTSECIFNSLLFQSAILIPDLVALFFWILLIYVVKKLILHKVNSEVTIDKPSKSLKITTHFKLIALVLFSCIAIASLLAFPKIVGFFSGKLTVKESCEDLHLIQEFSVNVEKGEVIAVRKFFNKERLLKSDIYKLNDCTVINQKNWSCGGAHSYGRTTSTQKSIDGVYEYVGGSEDRGLIPCKIEQLN